MRSRSGLLALLLLAAMPARAVFIKTQMERIDHEPLFDEHYFVSLLSFKYPSEWEDIWQASTGAYRINAASLDCCDLFLQQQLRFERQITKGLKFKFRLEQQEDKERQELHNWLEMEKRLFGGVSASIFGEPTFHKEDADVGFGLNYAKPTFKASARRYFVDFNFNKRGATTQRYARYPMTDEFALEWRPRPAHRVSGWLEIDQPTRRHVPDEKKLFSYRRINATVAWRKQEPAGWNPRAEYSYEFQVKGNHLDPDPTAASIENRRQVHRFLAAAEGALSDRDRLEAGQALLVRNARTDYAHSPGGGIFYQRWEAQPYARWRRQLEPWLISDLGTFLSLGDNRRRLSGGSALAGEKLIQAKLGAGLDFLFSTGRLGLYTTWNLDTPTSPWGGGNIRAMFLF